MTATETLTRPSTTSPPKPMDLHILDKDSQGQPAEKTLCGLAWDRLNPQRNGPLCKECERIVTERGHGHLLPFIGRAPAGE